MRKGSELLAIAALACSMLSAIEAMPAPRVKPPRQRLKPINNTPEMEAWNAAVEAKRQAKKARKKAQP